MEFKYQYIYILFFFVLLSTPTAVMYSGSLSVNDGSLIATGFWNNPLTSISWNVDNTTTPGMWHYEYTLTTFQKGISHWILEASDETPGPAFSFANLFNVIVQPSGWLGTIEIENHNDGIGGVNPNPYMPEDMYGIKFNAASGQSTTIVNLQFDSDRIPIWGDFYAKCGATSGEMNTVYNEGFSALDPLAPLANGSIFNHIIVPDTQTVLYNTAVPEPSTTWMLAIIISCIVYNFMKRK